MGYLKVAKFVYFAISIFKIIHTDSDKGSAEKTSSDKDEKKSDSSRPGLHLVQII